MTGWLVPSVGQKIPVQPGLYLPLQKILLAENRFLQAGQIEAELFTKLLKWRTKSFSLQRPFCEVCYAIKLLLVCLLALSLTSFYIDSVHFEYHIGWLDCLVIICCWVEDTAKFSCDKNYC